MRIINDGLPKEDIKWVKNFSKDYDAESLTILFTSDWRKRFKDGKKFIWRSISQTEGQYTGPQHAGFLYGIGGHRNLPTPLIIVKIGEGLDWKSIFLHEFAHYLDDKTTGLAGSRKRQEKVARDFSDILKAKFENKEELEELYEINRKFPAQATVGSSGEVC